MSASKSIATPTTIGANDREDMVVVTIADLRPMMPYQTALELAHHLRMHCKTAARHDRQSSDFWPDVPGQGDLNDCPKPNRQFRRSRLVQNFNRWQVGDKGAEVALGFDGRWEAMGYEDGIRLHNMIRRAARRAKAWAGDSQRSRKMLSNLTNAEDDYRIGLG